MSKGLSMKNSLFSTFLLVNYFILSGSSNHVPLKNIKDNSLTKKTTKKIRITKTQLKQKIEDMILKKSSEFGLPKNLLMSICSNESGLIHTSFRKNDGGTTDHAFGLCQVLRTTAERILRKKDPGCLKDYSKTPKRLRRANKCMLFSIETNIKAAALYLKDKLKKYPNSIEDAIAAYNSGRVKRCSKSKIIRDRQGRRLWRCLAGERINQTYVNNVLKKLGSTPRKVLSVVENSNPAR